MMGVHTHLSLEEPNVSFNSIPNSVQPKAILIQWVLEKGTVPSTGATDIKNTHLLQQCYTLGLEGYID